VSSSHSSEPLQLEMGAEERLVDAVAIEQAVGPRETARDRASRPGGAETSQDGRERDVPPFQSAWIVIDDEIRKLGPIVEGGHGARRQRC
jgi:hypothetical protein